VGILVKLPKSSQFFRAESYFPEVRTLCCLQAILALPTRRAACSALAFMGVELKEINPAYTSLIGAFKFQGFAISTHEKAAFVIARRSLGFSEDLEVFHGTRPAHGLMQEKLRFRATPRHVWGFYADNQGKIRELFMSEKKRRLCPSIRALSLAKDHPSLFRSYESPSGRFREILDRQNPDALDRASG